MVGAAPSRRRPALELRSVTLGYGERVVVRKVDLEVESGELVCLIGPNGAGKSTIVRASAGLLQPAAGLILLEGKDVREWGRKAMARRAAFVLQGQTLPPLFSVRETVAMGRAPYLSFWGSRKGRDREAIDRALLAFEANDIAERRLGELSGGELQRAILARALAQEPELLVVDEPTTYLDVHHQVAVLRLLRRLSREKEVAVLLILHDLNLACAFADRMVLLGEGRVARTGAPAEVLRSPEFRRIYGGGMRVVTIPGEPTRPVVLPEPPDTPDPQA